MRQTVTRPACPACSAEGAERWADKNGYAIWRCRPCGVLFSMTDDTDTATLYETYYDHATFEVAGGVIESLGRLVVDAERFRCDGHWMDVGYGQGALLSVAERHGWTCHGVERSPTAVDYGRRQGWDVSADLEDGRFGTGMFDVVSMTEVIEHVARPRRFFEAAGRWLRPGGLLYVTTPNAESLNRRCLGPGWNVVDPPEHAALWTADAVARVLRETGFGTVRVRTEGYNPTDVLNRLRGGGNPSPLNPHEIGRALSDTLNRSRSRRLLKGVLNASLNAMRLGDTLKVWAVRGASSLVRRPR